MSAKQLELMFWRDTYAPVFRITVSDICSTQPLEMMVWAVCAEGVGAQSSNRHIRGADSLRGGLAEGNGISWQILRVFFLEGVP